MPSALPDGDPAPADGSLPSTALARLGERPFGVYVHVPFCTVRCGYCDFNTYTASELGDVPGASRASYADAAVAEIRSARRVLGDADLPIIPVGGLAEDSMIADLEGMVTAIEAHAAPGGGLYDWATSTPEQWATLAPLAALQWPAPMPVEADGG